LDIKVYLYCSGATLASCQNSSTTGAGLFNYVGPTVSGVNATTAANAAGGAITVIGRALQLHSFKTRVECAYGFSS
jgi:hypothetical protein